MDNLIGKDLLGDLKIDEREIFKWILKKELNETEMGQTGWNSCDRK